MPGGLARVAVGDLNGEGVEASGDRSTSHDARLGVQAEARWQGAVGDGLPTAQESEEMLDIPAFLRRQAD